MVQVVRYPFLLFLGLFALLCPLCAQEPKYTMSEWFKKRHIMSEPKSCDFAMVPINQAMHKCKELNTFLRVSLDDVYKVCTSPTTKCKNGDQSCHRSEKPVDMIACKIKKKDEKLDKCTYRETEVNDYYTVACKHPDGGMKLTPYHLD